LVSQSFDDHRALGEQSSSSTADADVNPGGGLMGMLNGQGGGADAAKSSKDGCRPGEEVLENAGVGPKSANNPHATRLRP
jgi:hypothetical protein